jgi:hypothetical protein
VTFSGENLVELKPAWTWDPRNGLALTRRWRGTPAAVNALALDLRSRGLRYTIDPEESGYQVLASTSGAEESQSLETPLSDVWSLVGNDIEQDIWLMSKVQVEFAKFADTLDGAKVRKWLTMLANGDFIFRDEQGDDVTLSWGYVADFIGQASMKPGVPSLKVDVFEGLFGSLCAGVQSKPESRYVLRRVLTILAGSKIRPAYEGVNKVWSTDELKSRLAIPSTIMFDLPDGVWLKRTPTVEQSAADKWTITQEWWHADSYDPFILEPAL